MNYINDEFWRIFSENEGEKTKSFTEFMEKHFNGAFLNYRWLEHCYDLAKRIALKGHKIEYMARNVVMPKAEKLSELIKDVVVQESWDKVQGKIFFSDDIKHGYCLITDEAKKRFKEVMGYEIGSVEITNGWVSGTHCLVVFRATGVIHSPELWMGLVENDIFKKNEVDSEEAKAV